MRFHPFRPSARRARTDCPFCSGVAGTRERRCNICQRAGLVGGAE